MQRTKQINHDHRGAGSAHLTPSPQVQPTTRPTPQGLGRKFRLARPLRASDASSVSPDPSGPRTQTLPRPILPALGVKPRLARPLQGSGAGRRSIGSARLPTHAARTHGVTGEVTPIPQHGRVTTVPTTLGTVRPYLFHCVTLPLSLWCTASQ